MNTFYFARKKNTITTVYFTLRAQASPYDLYNAGGALPVGDAVTSLDGAAFANTAAQVQNPQTDLYSLTFTAAELNGSTAVVKVIDAAGGPNWCEAFIIVETFDVIPSPLDELPAAELPAATINAYPGTLLSYADQLLLNTAFILHLKEQDETTQTVFESDDTTPLVEATVSYDGATQSKARGT